MWLFGQLMGGLVILMAVVVLWGLAVGGLGRLSDYLLSRRLRRMARDLPVPPARSR